MQGSVREFFVGAAAKYLTAVDAIPSRSNQHEIGGLVKAGFGEYLDNPGKGNDAVRRYGCLMAYLDDEADKTEVVEDTVSWYDTRRRNPNRSAEYRLYYKTNAITERIGESDFFLIARRRAGGILMVFCPAGSDAEAQLSWLFGVKPQQSLFVLADLDASALTLPLRLLLDQLGIDTAGSEGADEGLLELMRRRFRSGYPPTREFSEFARAQSGIDSHSDPDLALVKWLEMEDKLFRIYERFLVAGHLRDGFGESGEDVDAFIDFSLSVQNRRKSRAGHALENHLDQLFREHGLRFERGGSARTTENKAKPDFLFPGFSAYHDPHFPVERLRLLGAKTSCKDRWRQVLAEGDRIAGKHLLTMQSAISEAQTNEMQGKGLQLIVPGPYQGGIPIRSVVGL